MIDVAVARAEAKHPEGLGTRPYDVAMSELLEAHAEWAVGDGAREMAEIMDTIAVLVRRARRLMKEDTA